MVSQKIVTACIGFSSLESVCGVWQTFESISKLAETGGTEARVLFWLVLSLLLLLLLAIIIRHRAVQRERKNSV